MHAALVELREIVERHAHESRKPTNVPGLTLARIAERPLPADTMYRPALCVAVQGRKRVVFGSETFAYDARSYVLATLDVPVRACIVEASHERPFLGLVFDVNAARLAELALELPHDRNAFEPQTGLVAGRLTDEIVDVLTRLGRLLDRPADAPILAPLLERELYYRLLQGECGYAVRQIATSDGRLAKIAVAAAWIRRHFAEALRIEDLAAMADMSVTSFYRHFKSITTMSPLHYRTTVRLQEARRKLLADDLDAATIGLDVGYESASQFSRDYRKMFGLPPGADAARLRLAAR